MLGPWLENKLEAATPLISHSPNKASIFQLGHRYRTPSFAHSCQPARRHIAPYTTTATAPHTPALSQHVSRTVLLLAAGRHSKHPRARCSRPSMARASVRVHPGPQYFTYRMRRLEILNNYVRPGHRFQPCTNKTTHHEDARMYDY